MKSESLTREEECLCYVMRQALSYHASWNSAVYTGERNEQDVYISDIQGEGRCSDY